MRPWRLATLTLMHSSSAWTGVRRVSHQPTSLRTCFAHLHTCFADRLKARRTTFAWFYVSIARLVLDKCMCVRFSATGSSLNYFLRDMQFPADLRIRAREYMRNSRDLHKKLSYNQLISSLSPDLRAEVVLRMSAKTLDQARPPDGFTQFGSSQG